MTRGLPRHIGGRSTSCADGKSSNAENKLVHVEIPIEAKAFNSIKFNGISASGCHPPATLRVIRASQNTSKGARTAAPAKAQASGQIVSTQHGCGPLHTHSP